MKQLVEKEKESHPQFTFREHHKRQSYDVLPGSYPNTTKSQSVPHKTFSSAANLRESASQSGLNMPRQMPPETQSIAVINKPNSFVENANSSKQLLPYPSQKVISSSSNGHMQLNSMFGQQYEAASTTSQMRSERPTFESKLMSNYGNSIAQIHEGQTRNQHYEPVKYIQVDNATVITEPSKKQAHASVGSADGTPAHKYDTQGFMSSDGIQAYANKLQQTIQEATLAEKNSQLNHRPLKRKKSGKRLTPLRQNTHSSERSKRAKSR